MTRRLRLSPEVVEDAARLAGGAAVDGIRGRSLHDAFVINDEAQSPNVKRAVDGAFAHGAKRQDLC